MVTPLCAATSRLGGGSWVRLTFTFTASGLAAPTYVAVSSLTTEELSPELCPDGILTTRVKNLCKGGCDLFNDGFGWLVFLRTDKKSAFCRARGGSSEHCKQEVHSFGGFVRRLVAELKDNLCLNG